MTIQFTFKTGDRVRVLRDGWRLATVISVRLHPTIEGGYLEEGVVVRIDGWDTGDKLVDFDEVEHVSVVDRLAELA